MTRPALIALALLLVGVLSAIPTRATPPSVPTPITDWRPIDRALHPLSSVPAGQTLTSEWLLEREPLPMPAPTLAGVASWYAYVPGGAAAGPALRAWLGPDWRGQRVTVCASRCVVVTISDWCGCDTDPSSPKVIDLDRASFAQLADPSRGVVAVAVSR